MSLRGKLFCKIVRYRVCLILPLHRSVALVKRLTETTGTQALFGGLTDALGKVTVEVRRGAERITGELPTLADIPRSVSGAQVPTLVRQRNTQMAMLLMELLTGRSEHLGLKSYAVYAVPGIALLAGIVLTTPLVVSDVRVVSGELLRTPGGL
jgi:hypothetical protein